MRSISITLLAFLFVIELQGQTVLSEQEILEKALLNSPNLKAADLSVQQARHLQKGSFNLSNPEITIESPTGEFMTMGIQQSINFPTVYIKQNQLLKQQTVLAENEKLISTNDVKYQVRSLYLQLQFYSLQKVYLKKQDSIYELIQLSSGRSYEAGQIDFLQKTFAESQYGEIHSAYLQSEADLNITEKQLRLITAMKDSIVAQSLTRTILAQLSITDTSGITSNPIILYYRQQQSISEPMLSLERHKMLPGLSFGYINQGPLNTPTHLRFRYGVSIPLWFWQYTGSIKAAKKGVELMQQRTLAQQQQVNIQLIQAASDVSKNAQLLLYYESKGNKQSEDLISSATRFFESGKYDLYSYLRTLNDAYTFRMKYIEALKSYNQSVLTVNYLNGSL
ncbi:MAG: TolC family protein [Bacteroidota bacterium]|nr:TolC family protein [Bacteroidota bacterium]